MSSYKKMVQEGDPEYFVGASVSSIRIFKDGVLLDDTVDYIIGARGIITYTNEWIGETCEIIETGVDDTYAKLDAIFTATAGSWIWNKRTNILETYDSNGEVQFVYEVTDDAESAKKERRQDLE
tara:strand:- start:1334 stop:1705 length:372 start_codon:yes stop_codon:yes gene_type:complete